MAKLMPPLSPNNLRLVDIVPRPKMLLLVIQENGLEDVFVQRQRRLTFSNTLAELMLVVRAVESHLNLVGIGFIGVNKVHGSESVPAIPATDWLQLGERDLIFTRFGRRLGT